MVTETKTVEGKQVKIIAGGLILFGLYLTGLYNYLLFHSLAEIFSIVVAFGIFVVAWHSRRMLDNNYLLFIGIGYLFVGGLDLSHTLAYKGMGVFQGYGANLSTQLWIAARYVQSLSLFIAPLVLDRKLRFNFVLLCYALVVIILLGSIFYWNIFPVCYVEGIGLTPFKKISEYLISLILVGSIVLLNRKQEEFERDIFRLLVASIIITIGAELAFTFYVSVYGLSNLIGHYFKLISFYLIYRAVVRTGIESPADILFFELKQSEEALKEQSMRLEEMVQEGTAELVKTNAELKKEIEEHKQAQEALQESEAQLQQARKMEAIGTLAGGIAHEFNNALGSITMAVGLIEKNYSDHENMAEYIETLKASADRMVLLIRHLLAYAEKGKYTAEIVSLNDLAEDALTSIRHTISPSIRVETNLAHNIFNIEANPTQIKMMMSAVVANAAEATEGPGRIRILTGNEAVDEEFAKTRPDAKPGRYACLSIEDEGKGMDEETKARLFDPFFSSRFQGRGLGMAAVYGIVKNHGGWISIDSEPGRGTAVRIFLPAVDAGAEESNEAKKAISRRIGNILPAKDKKAGGNGL